MWLDTLFLDLVTGDEKYWGRVAWRELCQNPWIPWETLEAFSPKVPLLQKYRHLHPDFLPEGILELPSREWAYFSKTAPMSFILETLEDARYHWVFRALCQNPGMTPKILADHFWPFLSYDVQRAVLRDSTLYQHPHFSPQDFPYHVNYAALSHNPRFRPSWLSLIPKRRWDELDWKHLSGHMDPSFIEETWNRLPWSLPGLSFHPRLPFSLVLRHRRNKKLDWDGVSLHVRLKDLCAHHLRLPFRYPIVSRNLHLRPWFVREFPMKKWDRIQLAIHPAMVPRDIFEDRLLFPVWRWDHALRNPSLDVVTLEKMRPTFVKRLGLFKNLFGKDPRYLALQAMRLQKFWGCLRERRETSRKVRFMKRVHLTLDTDTWNLVVQFI